MRKSTVREVVEVARRGTSKRRSVDQERFIAGTYGGRQSPSSGAADHDAGDVRTDYALIECKTTGDPERPAKSISLLVKDLEKIADEAYAEGRRPEMALRIHAPGSPLADLEGNIDLLARLVRDDKFLMDTP